MFFGQSFHEIKQVARVSCEPADGFYDNRVTAPDVFHHAGKLWAVGVFAACLVDENLVNAELAQQDLLSGGVLLLGADADVAYFQSCSSIHCSRVTVHFDIFQNFENNPIDIVFRCFRWVYSIDMLKKYRLLMSRHFCVQSSSMMSASRPITVSTPRMILPGFKLSPRFSHLKSSRRPR